MKSIVTLLAVLVPGVVSAHVRYIANDAEVAEFGGQDWGAFFAPMTEGFNIGLVVATILAVVLLYWILMRSKFFHKWAHHMVDVGESYRMFVPWIARLSLGIALIGAGFANVLISPVLPASELLATMQVVLGFFLLAGFLLGPSAIAVLVLFGIALSRDMYMIGAFDVLVLVLSLLILDDRRPGIDDIIGIKDITVIKRFKKYLPTIVRVGVGIGLAYLAIVEKVLNPHLSEFVVKVTELTGVIPVSEAMWVFSAGSIELALGVLLVLGLFTRLVSVVTFVVLGLSFFYFGEEVWSHVTLFGSISAIFILGGGPLSLDNWLEKRKHWWRF